jgi:hypothetical protein
MKGYFSIILILAINLTGVSQASRDWIQLNNGDTVPCDVLAWQNGRLFSKPNVTVDTGDARYLSYTSFDILSFQKGDTVFWSVQHRPWKKGNNKLVWAEVMMENGGHHILKYENVIQSEMGAQYELMYYHYKDREFNAEITNANYRQVFKDHFSGCPYIDRLLAEKKNFFRNDRITAVAEKYRLECME